MRGLTQGLTKIVCKYGPPDCLFTEFFRVHKNYCLEEDNLALIVQKQVGVPVIAQLMGEDEAYLVEAAKKLVAMGADGIDFNLGCPAPRVFRKNVGGGLLRDLDRVAIILKALRAELTCTFSVKTRVGFDSDKDFEKLLEIIQNAQIDLFTLHGRTVKAFYSGTVDTRYFKRAAQVLPCPVVANGDIQTAEQAIALIENTGCRGVMIGRAAIRNPWIFGQIRSLLNGERPFQPTLSDARKYVQDLYDALPDVSDAIKLSSLKPFLNYIGIAVDPDGTFLQKVRRSTSTSEMLALCDTHLLGPHADKPYATPYAGLIARPNREKDSASDDLIP
ncbi:MAG: hypothetical protein A2Y14_04305 [Verrucomicrobia bacterium GWF2_51_19]|nr:MAG: hypothetical protein A2Y14_04305 [Verrucomicrobia bacterium GWF2_51_19]HCJ12225.1 dihydrouridine synthase [Opitutae bacterium]